MRNRNTATGLGNPNPELMDGQTTGNKKRDTLINECAKDAYEIFFKGTKLDYNSVDAQAREFEVRIGVEPTYMYESLKMIVIRDEIQNSYIITGYAWDAYGSGIRSTRKYYKEYKTNSKFVCFINRWHDKLFQ